MNGFNDAAYITEIAVEPGNSRSEDVWLENLDCKGHEKTIEECAKTWNYEKKPCERTDRVGVVCKIDASTIRLQPDTVGSYTAGIVQVLHNSQWGTVCHDYWDMSEAKVACRQLGFTKALGPIWYGRGKGKVWLDDMGCIGSEALLRECTHNGWGSISSNCNRHTEDAGVACSGYTGNPTANIRLQPDTRISPDTPLQGLGGLVQVFHNNQWGTVCGDYWDMNDAKVACRQLGFNKTIGYLYSGQGKGKVWLDNMGCLGSEASLGDCLHDGWGVSDSSCKTHKYDAGVVCSGYQVRLQNGKSDIEGRIEVKYNGEWGTICDDGFGIQEANVVCKMLGFEEAITKNSFGAGQSSQPIWMKGISCIGNETSIEFCSSSSLERRTTCSHNEDVGVLCRPKVPIDSNLTVNVKVDGRVEISYYDVNRSICIDDWNIQNARVICRMNGFNDAAYITEIAVEPGNSRSEDVWLENLDCKGHEKTIEECAKTWNYGNKPCERTDRAGVVCKIVNATVRLVNGTAKHNGRLEVNYLRRWGTVCDDGWNIEASNVVCRMLGYPRAIKTKKYPPGQASQPILLDDVSCVGCERSINDCRHSGYEIHNCSHNNDVGIECLPAGKPNLTVNIKADGKVEISYYNVTRSICYDNWDIQDARVICRMKGFDDAAYTRQIANQNGEVWFLNVSCTGKEDKLTECGTQWNWENKPCTSNIHAGVKCRRDSDPLEVKFRLHFVNEKTKYSGRLSVYYYGTWGNLCAKDLKLQDAHVICRMLNFTEALTISHWDKKTGNTTFELKNHCIGNETSMENCKGLKLVQDNRCKDNNFAGIVCNPKTQDPKPDHIRLVGLADGSEGRVEIQKHGIWGTVCNSDWDMHEANVICRMKGFVGALTAYKQFGEGTGPIWLSGLQCKGTEGDIDHCYSDSPDKTTSCNHGMDAGVVCYNESANLKVKLEEGTSIYNGRVIVNFKNSERSICGDGWDIEDAHVVCRMLGLEKAVAAISHFGGGSDDIWLSNVSCTGKEEETSLEMCNHSGWGNSLCSSNHHAGVICNDGSKPNKKVILEKVNGTASSRIKVLYYGVLGTVSARNWDLADAHVVCWELTKGKASWAGNYTNEGKLPILIDDLNCIGSETRLEECKPNWGISTGDQTKDAGIVCSKVSAADKNSMKAKIISSNKNKGFGQVQLNNNGKDKAVCGAKWDKKDAEVVCKMKGYKNGALAAIKRYSINKVQPWLTGFTCRGQEQTIGECPRVSNAATCHGNFSAGVMCKSNEGRPPVIQVSLKDGNSNSKASGRVEILFDYVPGAVCNDGNREKNARVICHMLGYVDVSTYGSTYKPSKQITWLGNMECDGTEKSIENCKPKWGEATCNDDNILKVTCKTADVPRFIIINNAAITESTTTITFQNLEPLFEGLNGIYQIAVEKKPHEERFQSFNTEEIPFIFQEVNHTTSAKKGYNSYITAEVTSFYLTNLKHRNFTIGDTNFKTGKANQNDGFENEPLQPDSTYRVYVRIVTETIKKERIYSQYSYVAFKTKPVLAKGQAQKLSSSRGGGAVIGMSIVIIMLIAVIICASVWFIRKNRNDGENCYDKTQGLEMTNNGDIRTVNDIPEGYYQAPLRDEHNEYVTSPDKDRAAYQSLVTRTRITRNKQQENDSPLYVEIRS